MDGAAVTTEDPLRARIPEICTSRLLLPDRPTSVGSTAAVPPLSQKVTRIEPNRKGFRPQPEGFSARRSTVAPAGVELPVAQSPLPVAETVQKSAKDPTLARQWSGRRRCA